MCANANPPVASAYRLARQCVRGDALLKHHRNHALQISHRRVVLAHFGLHAGIDTVLGVCIEQLQGDLADGRLHCGELDQNLRGCCVVGEHVVDAAQAPLCPAEAPHEICLLLGVKIRAM